MKASIRAVVSCEVSIHVGDWGGGTVDLDQLAEQVKREAVAILRNRLAGRDVKIIGDPKATFIYVEE